MTLALALEVSLVQSLVLVLAFLDEQWQRMAEWQVDVGGVGACAGLGNGAGSGVFADAGKQWQLEYGGGRWQVDVVGGDDGGRRKCLQADDGAGPGVGVGVGVGAEVGSGTGSLELWRKILAVRGE